MSSNEKCIVSSRNCAIEIPEEKNLVFIIGSASTDYQNDIAIIIDTLKEYGYTGYFATRDTETVNKDIFCDKICAKIKYSNFCILLANSPIHKFVQKLPLVEELTKAFPDLDINYSDFRYPSPNVWYEYGIAQAWNKNIIPLMKRTKENKELLPFDVQFLEFKLYSTKEDLGNILDSAINNFEKQKKPLDRIIINDDYLLNLLDQVDENELLNKLRDDLTNNIPYFVEIVDKVDKEKLKVFIHGIQAFLEKINEFKNEEELFEIYITIYRSIIGLSIRAIYKENWIMLKQIYDSDIFLKSENQQIPLVSLLRYHRCGNIKNLIKAEKASLEYLKKYVKMWKLIDGVQLEDLYLQNNLLISFIKEKYGYFKNPFPIFFIYNSPRTTSLLSKIYLSNQKILKTITGEEERFSKNALTEYLINIPNFIDFPNFSLGDLNKQLADVITRHRTQYF